MCKTVITDKYGCHTRVNGFINRHIRSHIIRDFAGFTGLDFLLLHRRAEPFFIHAEPFFFKDFLRQIKGESIGIV